MVTNEDVAELLAMLSPRPDSVIEDEWLEQWCTTLPGSTVDGKGNVWVTVGDPAGVLFSSHVDTVHHGRVEVPLIHIADLWEIQAWSTDLSHRLILGADDTVGVWIMRRMIKAGIPGTYVFHRGEESGGVGSNYINSVENRARLLGDPCRYSIAVAFDRRGTKDVITHQGSTRTCSDIFAKALADELNKHPGLEYKPCDGGSFTDTKNYIGQVAECTNLSVGYYSQHSASEHIDLAHLVRFTNACLKLDWWSLPVSRVPGTVEQKNWGAGVPNRNYGNGEYYGDWYGSLGIISDPEKWIIEAMGCATVNQIMAMIQKSNWHAARAVSLMLELIETSNLMGLEEKFGKELDEREDNPGTTGPLPKDGNLEEPEGVESEGTDSETVSNGAIGD